MFRALICLLLAMVAATSFGLVEKQTYIVHMDKTKLMASNPSFGNTKQRYEELMDSVYNLSIEEEGEEETTPPHLLYTYENAFSGFAAKLSAKQLESLKRMDGFLFATADKMLSLHTTRTPQFLGLQLGKGLWSTPSLASDAIVGVIDTGIWPEHDSFKDLGMPPVPSKWKGVCENGTRFSPSTCNKKLVGARSFFHGYEAIVGRINETIEYKSPRDAIGHGTHTGSIAAGNVVDNARLFGFAKGTAIGMGNAVRIAAYKVCWPGCVSSDVLAAIDQGVADGVDVLSISLTLQAGNGPVPYYMDVVAIASFGAFQKGVSVVCSGGNFGPSFSTVDNTAPWIFTIAASYLDRSFPTTVKLGNGLTLEGSSVYPGKATKQLPLVYGKTAGGRGAEYCIRSSLNRNLVKGKIVVCQRDSNYTRTEQGEHVQFVGGAGMILINELFADAHVLPATAVSPQTGEAIIEHVKSSKNATASIVFHGTIYGTRAPKMAAFSARGPNKVGPDVIKPDITAPGMNVLAAWPPETSPSNIYSDQRRVLFNVVSGTSMSCPHISGLVALLKSVHKDWSPAAIKSALMTTAYTNDNRRKPIVDAASNEPATPFHFGSGHVNPEAANDPGLIYDITYDDYLNYLCSLNYNSSQVFAVSRSNFTCQKNLALQPGDLNYPSFAVNFRGKANNISVTYTRTVTNVGIPNSSYVLQLEEPNGVAVRVQPKVLKFEKLGQKLSYEVGFVGYERKTTIANASFGSLVWVSGKYAVRSPIAVSWW
ncbi:subtilisin-like protease SBT1.1 [Tripterygium wilfordii]|uniref:subtilisin-like protease SBT1.1 n=1 Tax=Tripterygium wilfordii TaxID=458696 RepID=UPI0018F837D3|nr:subtilisin-like protease SBT1.1 [Tripterygium wilfordii]XP_038681046.1 subtilisin-like protease SBT1.1 [Tripterygium wilfordii]